MSKLLKRRLVRVLLVAALLFASVVLLAALLDVGLENLAAVAAALAVMAAVVSAFGAIKNIELQEDALLPYPNPYIDASSRYQLLQLRIENFGGSAAHSIRLQWDRPLRNHQGNLVGCREIAVLMPQQNVPEVIDVDSAFFDRETDANYTGTISFRDVSGTHYVRRFHVSVEQYRLASSYDNEVQKTYHRVQQIPEHLKRLNRELAALRRTLGNR